jgi:hypothetical protein
MSQGKARLVNYNSPSKRVYNKGEEMIFRGKVVDSKNRPLPSAKLTMIQRNDSAEKKIIETPVKIESDGEFSVTLNADFGDRSKGTRFSVVPNLNNSDLRGFTRNYSIAK